MNQNPIGFPISRLRNAASGTQDECSRPTITLVFSSYGEFDGRRLSYADADRLPAPAAIR